MNTVNVRNYIHQTVFLFMLSIFVISSPVLASHPLWEMTTDQSDLLKINLETEGAANLAFTLAGFAPGPYGTPSEVASLAIDTTLKNTPAAFWIPQDKVYDPGAGCSYRIDNPSGFTEDTSSFFFITHNKLKNVWSDLGQPGLGLPKVFHPDADVSVSVENQYLYGDHPEFPPGHHQLEWKAETSINWVIDVALPGALIPAFSYAEAKWSLRPQTSRIVGLAEELGFISIDVSNAVSAMQWYQDTSEVTAVNRGIQNLTVWDTHIPYFQDASTLGMIESQTIQLEATDFGGVRLGRVVDDLRSRFNVIDECNRTQNIILVDDSATLLKVGGTSEVTWQTTDGGPYPPNLATANNQFRNGEDIRTLLSQLVTVVDTQAPILVPPDGFALESATPIDLTTQVFPLGTPRVVDLADPRPTFSNTAPTTLQVDHRYAVVWSATDASGNTTVAPPEDSDRYTQFITIKTPGTNTTPTAQDNAATTITSQPVEIELTGVDTDLLDGRVDPLAFKIIDYPANGLFDAPLLPFFIEDLRLTPVGDNEKIEENTIVRTSSLLHLADAFRLTDRNNRGTFLNANICNAATGTDNENTFNHTIPVDFVYEPSYVYVDDEGFYYIRDKFWVCGHQLQRIDASPDLSPIPRLSKWSPDGRLVAMHELYPVTGRTYSDNLLDVNRWPDPDFGFDAKGRIWFKSFAIITTFADQKYVMSIDSDLQTLKGHGYVSYDEQETIYGNRLYAIASDPNRDLIYELHTSGVRVRPMSDDYVIEDAPAIGADGVADCDHFRCVSGRDIKVDSQGYVYVLDILNNRIYKLNPPFKDDTGKWKTGEVIGWMGSCSMNKTNSNGVPYHACDEVAGTSYGYQCTDEKCNRATDTSGSAQGQFSDPNSIELSPQDILYVADTGNSRVQRFGADGSFAGEAKSTGTGVNLGSQSQFILGNMGEPKQLSVNSTAFYVMEPYSANGDYFVHVFKTLPFYDVTPSSAKVKYVSYFDFQGNDTFSYIVDDGIAKSTSASVIVAVSRAYRPPEYLASQCYADFTSIDALIDEVPCTLNEDGNIVVRISAKDRDGFISAGGLDTHTFSITQTTRHGQLTLLTTTDNAAVYRYTPETDYNGTDSFSFNASDGVYVAAQDAMANFTVVPQPDPVVIDLPDNIRAARGFSTLLMARFSDVDEDQQPQLLSLSWGDGVIAQEPDWQNSGRTDSDNAEISPQMDFVTGRGAFLGSHLYSSAGNYALEVEMQNYASDGMLLGTTQAATNVQVIEATMLSSTLLSPTQAVSPDTPFDVTLKITNQLPQGWDGLAAGNTQIVIKIPQGMTLLSLDSHCSGAGTITCLLGNLAPDASTEISFQARISLVDARENIEYPLDITMADDGPKVQDINKAIAKVQISDQDQDGTIDVDDAFPNDARYAKDVDHDGMADEWEQAYGLNSNDPADAMLDPDGDGVSNYQEFVNDTYPLLAEALHTPTTLTIDQGGDDRLGIRIAAGDINGDGYSDVVAGAPGYNNQGAIVVYYGSNSGVNASAPITKSGTTEFGRIVVVGDINNDGYADIAVKSDQDAYLYLGGENGLSAPILIPKPNTDTTLFGNAMVIADIDNDQLPDLLIASPEESVAGFTNNGAVHVYRATSQYWLQIEPVADMIISLGQNNAKLGDSLVVMDADGDKVPDLLVGAAFSGAGNVYGYLGDSINWTTTEHLAADFSLSGEVAGNKFAYAMTTGADVDGDNVNDLLVSSDGNNGYGAVYLYRSTEQYWNTAATPTKIQGYASGDQFGVSVALMPTMAYTGEPAIVSASNRAERDATTPDEGRVDLYSISYTTTPWYTAYGNAYDMLGYFVTNAGDINGDGENDIAMGAPDISVGTHTGDGGYVRIYYAGKAAMQTDSDADFVADQFDNCLADANTDQADADGDGIGDLCDSTPNGQSNGGGGESSGGGGGGCTYNPAARFDPMLLLFILLSAIYLSQRRYCSPEAKDFSKQAHPVA
jgi:hypothetical protein